MQYDKAEELRIRWGRKPCPHPAWEKEEYLSSLTGEKVCTQCGHSVPDDGK